MNILEHISSQQTSDKPPEALFSMGSTGVALLEFPEQKFFKATFENVFFCYSV